MPIKYSQSDLEQLEQRFRTALINNIHGYKPLTLVGTKSNSGHDNLAVFSSLFHLGANPALIGMVVRPDVSPRHTLTNIRETGNFSLSHVTAAQAKQAHQTSARYPAEVSEFDACGFKRYFAEGYSVPAVEGSPIKIWCSLVQEIPLTQNGTHLVIGAITYLEVDDKVLKADGSLDLTVAQLVACGGLDTYYTGDRLFQLTYAKPDRTPEEK